MQSRRSDTVAASDNLPPARTKEAPAPLRVSAGKFFADYQANEVAADATYRGKQLLVTGTVVSIEKNAFDQIIVHLATPDEFSPVIAQVKDSQTQAAAALTKGAKVNLLCTGGTAILKSPTLTDCLFSN